tara:strand:+ start:411 stop:560 length:150 start_codon:yes stop_codon:yes gene_type:complete
MVEQTQEVVVFLILELEVVDLVLLVLIILVLNVDQLVVQVQQMILQEVT